MESRPRRSRLLVVVAVLFVAVAVLLVFSPVIASATIARGIAVDVISGSVAGPVTVDSVSLSWFGEQRVRGVKIADAGGNETTDVDVALRTTLVGLLTGLDTIDASVTGAVRADVRDDGSTSLHDLLATPSAPETSSNAPAATPGGSSSGPIPRVHVDIDDLQVTLRFLETPSRTMELVSLRGVATVDDGGAVIRLASATRSDSTTGTLEGSLDVDAVVNDLFRADGALSPRGATVAAEIALMSVPVPFAPHVKELQELRIDATSEDLAERLGIELRAISRLGDGGPSRLDGDLTLVAPFDANDGLDIGIHSVRGTLAGTAVPSALVQPFLAESGVELVRDAGAAFDVQATFAPDAAAADRIDVAVSLTSEHMQVAADAVVNADTSVDARRIEFNARVHPELFNALTGWTLAAPAPLQVVANSVHLPARQGTSFPLGAIAFDATLTAPASMIVGPSAAEATPWTIRDTRITAQSDGLVRGVHAVGAANIEDGRIEFDERLTGLVNQAGAFTPARIVPVGRTTISGLRGDHVLAMLPESARTDVVRTLLAGPLDATLVSAEESGNLAADVDVQAGLATASATLVRRDDRLDVRDAVAGVALTAPLIAAVQADSEKPAQFTGGRARVTVGSTSLPVTDDGYAMPAAPIEFDVRVDPGVLTHASLAEPIGLGEFSGSGSALLGDASRFALAGTARIDRTVDGTRLADVRYDLTARAANADADLEPAGTVRVEQLSVRGLEAVLGRSPETLSGTLGATGAIELAVADASDGRAYVLTSELERLRGAMTASIENDLVSITSEALQVTVGRQTLEAALNDRTKDAGRSSVPAPSPATQVTADVPITVTLDRAQVPLGLISGESFDPAAVDVRATVRGGPLVLAQGGAEFSRLSDIDVSVTIDDLREGIAFSLTGDSSSPASAAAGVIDVSGRLRDVMTDDAELELGRGALTMDARVEHLPTAIVDTLVGFDGKLLATIGEQVSGTINARAFSADSGALDTQLTATNGTLEGAVTLADGMLMTSAEKPLRGSLAVTEPFRRQVLRGIHPVLSDVQKVDDLVRVEITNAATIPLDGSVERMNADIALSVGDVIFRERPELLWMLGVFDRGESVRGSIQPVPVVARIRDGVVTCEQLNVGIDDFSVPFMGSVDLIAKQYHFDTMLPLEAVGVKVKEIDKVRQYLGEGSVPMVIAGSLSGKPKVELAPNFLESLLESAIEKQLGGVIEKELGGLLGDLFGGDKDK